MITIKKVKVRYIFNYAIKNNCLLALLFILLAPHNTAAQTETQETNSQAATGIFVSRGQVIVHTPSVADVKGTNTFSFLVDVGRQLTSRKIFNAFKVFPVQGLELSYNNFDKKFLGQAFAASYFLQPVFPLTNRLQFQMKATAGLLYATNPFDSVQNFANKSYSSHINFHLTLSAGFNYVISRHLLLEAGVSLRHFSNAGYKHPNAGVNFITGNIGIAYRGVDARLPHYTKGTNEVEAAGKRTYIDAGVFFVPREGYYITWDGNRRYAAGLFASLTRRVGMIHAFSINAESYYNSLNIYTHINTKKFKNNVSSVLAGIAVGHDFILGNLTFGQQFGVYVTKRPTYYPGFYQRYSLLYKLSSHMLVGVSCKAHGNQADFADMRIVTRF